MPLQLPRLSHFSDHGTLKSRGSVLCSNTINVNAKHMAANVIKLLARNLKISDDL